MTLIKFITMKKSFYSLCICALTTASFSVFAQRNAISIVGSSTVYPFTTVVAEQFGQLGEFRTPRVESTGTGGGFKLFCQGVGLIHPDIVNASRKIKPSEITKCSENGIHEILEVKVGFDGIAIASSINSKQFPLSLQQLYLSLAKMVPTKDGTLVENPYRKWSDIDATLPNQTITVYGPPPTSGTRDAFVEIGLEKGALQFPLLKQLRSSSGKKEILAIMKKLKLSSSVYESLKSKSGKKLFKLIAHGIREDGYYIEMGENDNLIMQKLKVNPNALGILGYSYLEQNLDVVKPHTINGIELTFDNIAEGDYPISRSLYIYTKIAHYQLVAGLKEFLEEYTSDISWGEEGYLSDLGLIPLTEEEREKINSRVQNSAK